MNRNMKVVLIIAAGLVLVLAACSGGETAATASSGAASATAAAAAPAAAPAAKGTPIDNNLFSTVLPDGWEVMADDLANMGMMTLAKKGTGGATGVYLKFEGNGGYSGDPMKDVESFASSKNGTPAETASINGIDWARTAYEAYGTKQTMLVTKHNGTKVTATVMGDAASPEVQAILGSFKLK